MSIFGWIRDIYQAVKYKEEIRKLRDEDKEKKSQIQKPTDQQIDDYNSSSEREIEAKARKMSLTTILLLVELVVILVGLTGIFVTAKDMRSRMRTVDNRTRDIETQIAKRNFKITSPSNGDSVDIAELIQGETPFRGMHHYVIVTPVKIGTDFVEEEAKVSPGGLWSGNAVFGTAAVGAGEKFVVRALVTNSTLSPGPLSGMPKDAIFSESITVTRKK